MDGSMGKPVPGITVDVIDDANSSTKSAYREDLARWACSAAISATTR